MPHKAFINWDIINIASEQIGNIGKFVSDRIGSYRIVSRRSVSFRVVFKNFHF